MKTSLREEMEGLAEGAAGLSSKVQKLAAWVARALYGLDGLEGQSLENAYEDLPNLEDTFSDAIEACKAALRDLGIVTTGQDATGPWSWIGGSTMPGEGSYAGSKDLLETFEEVGARFKALIQAVKAEGGETKGLERALKLYNRGLAVVRKSL